MTARGSASRLLDEVRAVSCDGERPAELAAHRAELERCQRRRAEPSAERVRRERRMLVRRALGERSLPMAEVALADFPWTSHFTAADHAFGDLGIHLVDVPSDVPAATSAHAVAAPPPGQPTLLFYSASWVQQRGVHPHASYDGEPIDYLRFAPTYFRISTRDIRPLIEGVDVAVRSLVTPVVWEAERKLTEYAVDASTEFCHPALDASFDAIFRPRIVDRAGRARPPREVVTRFSKLVLLGYSSGGTAILQHVAKVRTTMLGLGYREDEVAAALERVLAVLVAPNVHFERWPALRVIAARSPLDAVITGHGALGLCSTMGDDRSLEGFTAAEIAHLARGELDAVDGAPVIVWSPSKLQINLPLPGIVRFSADGTRGHPFRDGKNGHDCKPYVERLRRHPVLVSAIRRALDGDDPLGDLGG